MFRVICFTGFRHFVEGSFKTLEEAKAYRDLCDQLEEEENPYSDPYEIRKTWYIDQVE